MPPKVKIDKDNIIKAAVQIVRERGIDALNARAVAQKLNCSTQPIFSNYDSMNELKKDVMNYAEKIYLDYVYKGMKSNEFPPYKGSGMAYIRFAEEEKEFFKFLFMRDRSNEKIKGTAEDEEIISLIQKNTGLDREQAFMFHMEMWVYVHGIAVMIATSYLDWNWDMISQMLTDAYEGMKMNYLKKGDN